MRDAPEQVTIGVLIERRGPGAKKLELTAAIDPRHPPHFNNRIIEKMKEAALAALDEFKVKMPTDEGQPSDLPFLTGGEP